jgi:hypothetical protein
MGAAIGFTNLLDIATVSASGFNILTPPSNVQTGHVAVKWVYNSSSGYLLFDLGSAKSADTFMLAGVEGSAPVFRVRQSSLDASGAAGDVFDTGLISGLPYFDANFGRFVYLASTPHAARYVRFDISGVTRLAVGRAFGGLRSAFGINFQTPWSRTPVRRSVLTDGVGGQTFIDLRRGYWKIAAQFGFLSETERTGFVNDIGVQTVNQGHADFLWINDIASDNLSRDCIWGFQMPDEQPVTQNLYTVPPVYSVEFMVRDRL